MLPDTPTLEQYLQAADATRRARRRLRSPPRADADALEAARIQFLGDRRGELLSLQKALGTLPAEAASRRRPRIQRRQDATRRCARRAPHGARSRATSKGPQLDLTMPARHRWIGGKHPVTLVIDEIVEIFRELGFTVALGPETESEWYNFGALNFPPDHPAMDLHDTLYLGDGALLRTHTSPVQVRTLQRLRAARFASSRRAPCSAAIRSTRRMRRRSRRSRGSRSTRASRSST